MSKALLVAVCVFSLFCSLGCRSVSKKTPQLCDCSQKEPWPPVAVKVTPEPMPSGFNR